MPEGIARSLAPRPARPNLQKITMKSESLFYIQRTEENVSGPYDLVQMAGLLRKKIITADTHTRLVGEENWQPFSWQPQFSIAREMPADAA
jgi:hypothetical protein